MQPLVSVIIPTFNRAWCLQQAIDSVLAQDYPAMEIIVVDDGSTDDTGWLLEPYQQVIKVIRQNNAGVSAARNRGIRAAKGQWIALLDSDDIWLPGKLSRQMQYLQARAHLKICQTEEIWIRNGRRVNPAAKHTKAEGMIFEKCLPLCLVSPSAVVIHTDLLEEVGLFDERLPACEDYDMWLRISCRHQIGLVPEPLIVKRGGHADQLSRSPALDRYRIRALEKIITSGILLPGQRKAALAMLQAKCRIYAGGCRKRGRIEEARHYEDLAARLG